jgi:hypothetical protein
MSDAPRPSLSSRRWQWVSGAAPVVAVLAIIGFWMWQMGAIRTPAMPAVEDQRALLTLARSGLSDPGTAAKLPIVPVRHDVRGVMVSVYFPGTQNAPMRAWEDVDDGDLAEAVAKAAAKLGHSWNDAKRAGAGSERMRVDLTGPERRVLAVVRRPDGRLRFFYRLIPTFENVIDPGVDGLVIRDGSRQWFFNPSELVERSLTSTQAVLQLRKNAGDRDAIRRFRAASFIEGPGASGPLTIVRGNVLPPYPATAAALREASARGGAYLARAIDDRGRFTYLFEAKEARSEGGFNLLRHAGTLWAMFQVYRDSGDPAVRAAAERGLAHLGREYAWRDPRVPDAIFLREGAEGRPKTGDVKLGACGLGILAYVEAEKAGIVLSPEDRALLVGLGRGILAMQKEDGELTSYYATLDRPANPRRSVYYPGEAILGLAELYKRDGDKVWLDAAQRAADFQIQRRWKRAGIEVNIPPDAWLTQALEQLWLATKEDRYKSYAYQLGDELLTMTFPVNGRVPPDLRGATFTGERIQRVTPTSSRNEAVVAAARLAHAAGDEERSRRYLEAARAAAWFGVSQQFRPESVHFVRAPDAAIGAIREANNDNSVRIDGVQHAVSGFLGIAEMLEPKPAVTTTSGGPS